jgi:hypothetical protein
MAHDRAASDTLPLTQEFLSMMLGVRRPGVTVAATILQQTGAMTGGVAEWVADCWFKSYTGAPSDGRARLEPGCRKRVVRGGSWRDDQSYATSSARLAYDADVRYVAHGLRVARDLP